MNGKFIEPKLWGSDKKDSAICECTDTSFQFLWVRAHEILSRGYASGFRGGFVLSRVAARMLINVHPLHYWAGDFDFDFDWDPPPRQTMQRPQFANLDSLGTKATISYGSEDLSRLGRLKRGLKMDRPKKREVTSKACAQLYGILDGCFPLKLARVRQLANPAPSFTVFCTLFVRGFSITSHFDFGAWQRLGIGGIP
ncbi:hypothetical protein SDJN02_07930, partial [Cucurbita argyrosperma subsp. argyrosperma]